MDVVDNILALVKQATNLPAEQAGAIERQVRSLHGGCEVYIRKHPDSARAHGLSAEIAAALQRGVPVAAIPGQLGCSRRVVYKHMGRRNIAPR